MQIKTCKNDKLRNKTLWKYILKKKENVNFKFKEMQK